MKNRTMLLLLLKKQFLFTCLGLFGCLLMLQASSHQEAPLIANDPLADNTDLYAFRSPDDPNTITIIANYTLKESRKRPKHIDINKILSIIYYEKRAYEKAKTHLILAKRTQSENPELLLVSGLIDVKLGNKKEGQKSVNKAKILDPYMSNCLTK